MINTSPKPLAGKVAVVTGAAGILCSRFVEELLEQGAKVVLLGRTLSKLESLQEEMNAKGLTSTLAISCDVLDRRALEAAHKQVSEKFGVVSILVNGAGGNKPGATSQAEQLQPGQDPQEGFSGLNLEDYMQVFDLNFKGTLLPTQVFTEDMIAAKDGCVINISSMSADRPLTKVGAYSASKAAVDSFTQWLSVHLAPVGIRVNALAPGFFVTDQNRFLLFQEDGKTPSARGGKIIAGTPAGRFGDATELKSAIRFLASPDSGFVTGIILPVDGGFSAYGGV